MKNEYIYPCETVDVRKKLLGAVVQTDNTECFVTRLAAAQEVFEHSSSK